MEELDNLVRDEERRKFFRIDDHVMLKYQIIAPQEISRLTERLKSPLPNPFTLASDFSEMKQATTVLQRAVEQASAPVAKYLQYLDKKLDMIAKVLMVQEMGTDDHLWRRVNLGAGGMSLESPVEMSVGAVLEIWLGLLPSHAGLHTIGKVIRCDKNTNNNGYDVALAFQHVRESDRELLVQHVLWRQSHLLREARETREHEGSGG